MPSSIVGRPSIRKSQRQEAIPCTPSMCPIIAHAKIPPNAPASVDEPKKIDIYMMILVVIMVRCFDDSLFLPFHYADTKNLKVMAQQVQLQLQNSLVKSVLYAKRQCYVTFLYAFVSFSCIPASNPEKLNVAAIL